MTRTLRIPALSVRRVVAAMIVGAVVGGAGGFALAANSTADWQASRSALIRVWSIDSLVLTGQSADVTVANLADAATVMTSSDVIGAAAKKLNESEASLARVVSASASQTSDFVTVQATGPTSAIANLRVDSISRAFVTVVRHKVLASATRIAALSASTGTVGQAQAQIITRAAALAVSNPVQIYRTTAATRLETGLVKQAALGVVVGLALAALLVVLLTFAGPRLRRPSDVIDELGLPAMAWTSRDIPILADGMGAELIRAVRHGAVAVCAVRPQDAQLADEFGRWLTGPTEVAAGDLPDAGDSPADAARTLVAVPERPRPHSLIGVVHIGSPADGLAVSRPPAASITAAVLVTAVGAPADTVQRAAELLGGWRAVDAVVLVG